MRALDAQQARKGGKKKAGDKIRDAVERRRTEKNRRPRQARCRQDEEVGTGLASSSSTTRLDARAARSGWSGCSGASHGGQAA